ncbi:MAG TPA: hypothetical protein VMV94_05800 [Phycisphaerae bacterium]|nr:hypothetical protein [Phycisphaerae bacterium]
MRRHWAFSLVVVGIVTAITSTTLAQDQLAPVMTKAKLAKEDRDSIENAVAERVRRLGDAGNEKDRGKATEKLVAPIKTQGATKAALDAYADACATQLGTLVLKDSFDTAFNAVRVLLELDNQNAAPALAAALKSKYAAVRYQGARGLQLLHPKLKGEKDKSKAALQLLGDAGAAETDKVVLEAIYQAINFYSDVPDFQSGDDCAHALNTIFAARAKRMTGGPFDELVDEPAFEAAAASYASASPEEQVKLAQYLSLFLSHAVNRYFAGDTAEEYLPTLAGLIKKMEDTLRTMIKASGKDAPQTTISGELGSKASPAKKEAPARSALQNLLAVLKGEPWNLS